MNRSKARGLPFMPEIGLNRPGPGFCAPLFFEGNRLMKNGIEAKIENW